MGLGVLVDGQAGRAWEVVMVVICCGGSICVDKFNRPLRV